MKYRELREAVIDATAISESINLLKSKHSLDAPESVMEQFYIDHSANEDFINLYGHIDLRKMQWKLKKISAGRLCDIGENATYPEHVADVAEDVSDFVTAGNKEIHADPKVREYWERYGTWRTPPIFISGNLLNPPNSRKYHLVEGHTRVGTLIGLRRSAIIHTTEQHLIFYGK